MISILINLSMSKIVTKKIFLDYHPLNLVTWKNTMKFKTNPILSIEWQSPPADKKYMFSSITILKKKFFLIVRKGVNLTPILLGLFNWKLYIKLILIFGKFTTRNGKNSERKINLNVPYLLIVRLWFFICI